MRLISRSLIGLLMCFFAFSNALAIDGTSINGRGVSVQWRYVPQSWGIKYDDANAEWKGSMVLYYIKNGKVDAPDTIINRTQGLCFSPAFNMNGTKIAFFRLGRGIDTNNQKITVNDGKTTISVYDIATGTVTNLCDLAGEPYMLSDGTGGLDWPAGDEIYFLNPKANGDPTDEVCKVNLKTNVVTSIKAWSMSLSFFRRFSMALTANKMGAQIISRTGGTISTSSVGPFPDFPPSGAGNCNSCISPSGNYETKFQGNHTELYFLLYPGVSGSELRAFPSGKNDDGDVINDMIRLSTFQNTTTDQFGYDVDGLGFSCNSDKWVLQNVGWHGHADEMRTGSNSVACNWADVAAIRLSNNPKTALETCAAVGRPGRDCCGGCGTEYKGSDIGDLWVDGGAANAGKYEDANGNWHSVANGGTDYLSSEFRRANATAIRTTSLARHGVHTLSIMRTASGLGISLPSMAHWKIKVIDCKGTAILSQHVDGAQMTLGTHLARGVYVLHARSGSGEIKSQFVIDK